MTDAVDTLTTALAAAAPLAMLASDGVCLFDSDGKVRLWNPAATGLTGIPATRAHGLALGTILTDLGQPHWGDALRPVLRGEGVSLAGPLATASLESRHCELRVVPWLVDGRICGGVATLNDLAAPPAMAARLAETEHRFTLMADAAPVLLWMSREDSLCTFFNQSWLRFTGRSLAEEWGVGWVEGVHPLDLPHCLDTYQRAFVAREPFEMEYRLRRADGEFRWVLDRGVPRYAPNGTFAGYIGSCIDITDRRHLHDSLQRAVRTRDDFLAIASHELRTPLTTLSLQTELLTKLLQRPEGPTTAELLARTDTLRRQCLRLEQLVNTLMDVSQLTSGSLGLVLEPVDLAEVAEECRARLTGEGRRSDTPISLHASGPVIGIWDRLRLEEVVTNLLTNALKYGAGRPVDITLAAADGWARLSVQDQGIGIAEEDQERIFQQFERAVSVTNYGGFGVGLWIARGIVTALGGTLTVASAIGQGATFTMTLRTRP